MIKFYYSGAPNPMKVALMLEECGLPYEPIPVDTRKGEQHKPDYPGDQSERQGAGDRRRRRHRVRLERDPALSRREDRQVPARQHADKARGELLSWLMFVASGVGPFSGQSVHFRNTRRRRSITPSTATCLRGAAPLRHSRCAARPSRNTCSATPTGIVDMAVWGWARLIPNALGEGDWAKFPNLKRLVDEISRAAGGGARQRDARTSTSSRPSSTRKRAKPCSGTWT